MSTKTLNGSIRQFFKQPGMRNAKKVLRSLGKCFLTIFLIGIMAASIVGCILVVYVFTTSDSKYIPDLDLISQNETSIIYVKDSSGEWVENQRVEGTNSIWTNFEDIPVAMQNAVIAIEDKRFRTHNGVDWTRTISAFANLLLSFKDREYGGSTITQQLIKNLSNDKEVKISRKVREIFRALELERNGATKDEIMEAYLNILPLSDNIEGVGAAANYYFAKDAKDLTIAECAVIAGITQNPSKYNPYTRPDNVKQRQRAVLAEMYKFGYITEEEYIQAYNQEMVYKSSSKFVKVQSYYTDYLTDCVIEDLMSTYNYSREYATKLFYQSGLRIYSAENPTLQKNIEAIYAKKSNLPPYIESYREEAQVALFVMDYTGRVVTTIGGRGEKTANRIYNRSTDAVRQPGSAMKPIAVYTPAIDLNLVTFSTRIKDEPITLNGKKWPNNYGGSHYGTVTVDEAVQRSLNTIPVQLLQQITPQRSYEYLTNTFHLTTLVTSRKINKQVFTDIDLSPFALGGLTDGVKASEMAAAYAVFGNGGIYNKPFTYYKVERAGEVILENTPANVSVLNEDTAYVMNRLLQRVIAGPYGTARTYGVGQFETYGKTGTTTDNKDVYYAAGTPYYVGSSWVGYDTNKELKGTATQYARKLWLKAMTELHKGLPMKKFDKKGQTVELQYCTASGQIATDRCTSKAVGVYKPDNIPDKCQIHGASTAPPTTAPNGTTTGDSSGTTGSTSTIPSVSELFPQE